MTLYAQGSLRGIMETQAPRFNNVLSRLNDKLHSSTFGLYRVRRIYHAKGRADRSISIETQGSEKKVLKALRKFGEPVLEAGSYRVWVSRRRTQYPAVEEMLVAAPLVAAPKERESFAFTWERMTLCTL